jgi:hypothetical protein
VCARTGAGADAAGAKRWLHTRGTAPILATDPSLFYRAATEQLCRTFADYVVDSTVTGKPSRYQSKLPDDAVRDMVQTVMGIVTSG